MDMFTYKSFMLKIVSLWVSSNSALSKSCASCTELYVIKVLDDNSFSESHLLRNFAKLVREYC
jgi:hypothetical protein